MDKQLNGRHIRKICKICSVRHGKIKEPTNAPRWEAGVCDICEATGNANIPQDVAPASNFGGLSNDVLNFTNYKEPTV